MKTYLSIFLIFLLAGLTAMGRPTPPPSELRAIRHRLIVGLIDDVQRQYNAQNVRVSGLRHPDALLLPPEDKKDDKKDGQSSESAKKAKDLFDKLQKDKKDLPDYRTDMTVEFPLLLNLVTEGNKQVALCFNDVKIFPGYSEISMFAKIRISEYTFFFGADKLKYRENSGGGFFESGRLVLLGDATYKTKNYSFILKGGEIKDNGNFGDATSVYYNCGKFETLKLGGELWLNPEYFVPIDKKGKPLKDSTERVQTKLDVTLDLSDKFKNLDKLIVKLNFTPFTLKAYKNKIGFNVNNITLDLSETATPEGALKALETVDTLYNAKGDKGKKGKAWKGLHIETLDVYLPEELSGKDTTAKKDEKKEGTKVETKEEEKPLRSFKAANVLIGDVGFTASLSGFNVVRLKDEKPISEWDMSVDTVQIDFVNSTCRKFSIRGQVNIPQADVSACDEKKNEKTGEKKDDADKKGKPDKSKAMLLNYAGLVGISAKENTYSLGVKFASERKFGLLGGEATLKPNSAVELTLAKKAGQSASFEAKATLNGEWNFAVESDLATTKDLDKKTTGCPTKDEKDQTLGVRQVKFTDFMFMTSSPYFKIGSFAYSDTNSKMSNYPIFIEKLEVKTVDGEKGSKVADAGKDNKKGDIGLKLSVDVKFRVSLMDKAVSGKGDVGVLFDYGNRNDKFYMNYNSLSFREIEIKADFSAFKLDGALKVMKKDPDYGDGFMGRLNMLLGKTDPMSLKMNAIYSNTDAVGRCFYFDGSYTNPKAPLKKFDDKNLQLNGAAVGFAWKMAPTNEKSEFSVFNKKFVPKAGRYSLIAGVPYSNILPKASDTFDGNTLLTINFGGSYGIASVLAFGDIRVKTKTFEPLTENDLKAGFASAGNKLSGDNPVSTLAEGKDKAKKDDTKKDPKSGAFVANIGAELNLERGGLFIDGEAYLDMGALRGGYDKNKMGDVTIYAGKEGFYAWLGTPKNPLAAQFDVTSSARLRGEAYLDLGKLPPADQQVRTYPGGLISQLATANKKAQERGYEPYTLFNPSEMSSRMGAKNGMLLGASLNLDQQRYEYSPFYANIGGGVGLDVVINSYDNALCESGARVDGLYGSGQFYLYANVDAGVRIPKFLRWGPWDTNLADLSGLVIGKMGVPSPFYLDGLLYGRYRKVMWFPLYGNATVMDKEFVFRINVGTVCQPRAIVTGTQKAADLAKGIIWAEHEFKTGERIYASDKKSYLVLQPDGDLVSYDNAGTAVWASGTSNKGVTRMVFQKDGNLIAYKQSESIWATQTSNRDGQSLIVQNDGEVAIYTTQEKKLWSSNTGGVLEKRRQEERWREEQRIHLEKQRLEDIRRAAELAELERKKAEMRQEEIRQKEENIKKGYIYAPFDFEVGQDLTRVVDGKRYTLKLQPYGDFVVLENDTKVIWQINGSNWTSVQRGRFTPYEGIIIFRDRYGESGGTYSPIVKESTVSYLRIGPNGLQIFRADNTIIPYSTRR